MDRAFMDAFRVFFFFLFFSFPPQTNQTALVRQQHSSVRPHEGLHGTVVADHRLTLQTGDSSRHTDPRGRAEVKERSTVRAREHAHTRTHKRTKTRSVRRASSFPCAPITIPARLHHPVRAYHRESEDARGEKLRRSFTPTRASQPRQMNNNNNNRRGHLNVVPSRLAHLLLCRLKTNGIFPNTPKEARQHQRGEETSSDPQCYLVNAR